MLLKKGGISFYLGVALSGSHHPKHSAWAVRNTLPDLCQVGHFLLSDATGGGVLGLLGVESHFNS